MGLKPSDKTLVARGTVLDRLLDDEDKPRAHAMRLSELRDSVRRDLEMLLNTRQRCVRWGRGMDELDSSVFNYGIPDLLAMNMAAPEDRAAFLETVAALIRQNDSRFRTVTTHMLENSDRLDHTLRFRIEAVVQVSPGVEQIVFDSVVDPASKSIRIRSAQA